MSDAAEQDTESLHAFLLDLGRALTLAGAAVSETQERLARVAAANHATSARIVVLPTALIVASQPDKWATIEAIPQLGGLMRLDQISAVYELTAKAERGAIQPRAGVAELHRIQAMRPRHGASVTVLAYAAMTIAFCLILQPTPIDVAIASGLGLLVGMLQAFARGRTTITVLVPVTAAALVSAVSFELVKHGIADPGLRTLIAPLVTFLPGAALTTATVELASGEMVAGASRLVSGAVTLVLLAFGIVAGVEIAGLPSEAAVMDEHANLLGWWAPWLGVLVFGLAVTAYFSAPGGSLHWIVVVLLVAWLGQVVGERVVGADVSGFVGALAMTPVALLVARLPGGPPSQVTFLPAFWLLVPGALGLIGVTEVIGNPAQATVADLVAPIGSIVSIALGVLCGVSIFRGISAAAPVTVRRMRGMIGPQ